MTESGRDGGSIGEERWSLRGREEESEGGMEIAKEYERGRELLQQMERRPAGKGGWME